MRVCIIIEDVENKTTANAISSMMLAVLRGLNSVHRKRCFGEVKTLVIDDKGKSRSG